MNNQFSEQSTLILRLFSKQISQHTSPATTFRTCLVVYRFLEQVPLETLVYFRDIAQTFVEEKGAVEAVAAALAHISGTTEIKSRSLLSAQEVSGQRSLVYGEKQGRVLPFAHHPSLPSSGHPYPARLCNFGSSTCVKRKASCPRRATGNWGERRRQRGRGRGGKRRGEKSGGDSHMKRSGMLVVPLRGQNLGFWYRLGC